ncbi:hypothetical protein [uncultured Parabacteroides sp.]|uniref:hypothetical protein n=1 Tax=uncultured Parabacteroides sp. TaxID=512312 RepID=UPI00259786BB|nr:hypothetical protein [uncultured Parabacteroides sp.]
MKLKLCFVLINTVLFCRLNVVSACEELIYSPSCYYTYRMENTNKITEVEQNCLLWQQLTGNNVSIEDIREVVYEWDYKEVKDRLSFLEKIEGENNQFIDWIYLHNDREITECLLLVKQCEYLRKVLHKDPWYYSCEEDTVNISLSRLAEKAQAYTGNRLKDRYTLQAVRALFSLHRYEDCIRLWNSVQDSIPDGLIKNMTRPYIAGCHYRIGDTDKAVSLYAACGDVNSMFHCLKDTVQGLDEVGRMRLVRSYNTYYTDFSQVVWEMIHKVEEMESYYMSRTYWYGGGYIETIYELNDFSRNDVDSLWVPLTGLYDFSLELANDKHTSNRGTWYYTAAYLADKLKKPTAALQYIRQARCQLNTDYMQESIQVLDIYLSAKYTPSMVGYEERLRQDLKKMEALVQKHLTPKVIKETEKKGDYQVYGYSFYYWNDMLRKLLLSVVAPRYLKEGKPVRAIQMVNMADNLLFRKVQEAKQADCRMDMIRKSTLLENPYDYRNRLFELLDTLEVEDVVTYMERLQHPQSEFDRYLNDRGYVNLVYFYDVIGSKYLYQCDYAKAVTYLEKVPISYQYTLNTSKGDCLRRDPFQPETFLADCSDYKLKFAKEMHLLWQQIHHTTDVNRKAQLQIRYAIGLRNSFESCWALTQYAKSCYESERIKRKKEQVRKEYDRLTKKAFALFTDPESAARAYWLLGYYKKVVREYPNTQMAHFAWTHCDNLRDYFPH